MKIKRIVGEAVGMSEKPSDATPKWQKIFALGTFHRRDMPGGSITFDREFFDAIVDNWKKAGGNELPFDYFHQGGSDVIAPLENKIASGWMTKLEARDDGVYALTRWTERARQFILNDELAMVSPYFHPNAIDPKTGKPQGPTLFAAGLLNDPFLKDLPRVAASEDGLPTNPTEAETAKGKQMDKKILLAALGMPEDATDEMVMEKIKEGVEAMKMAVDAKAAMADTHEKLSLSEKTLSAKDEAIKLAQDVNAKLADTVKALEKEKLDTKIAGVVSKLEQGGNIIASQKEAVAKYAYSTSPDEALKFFSAFKAVTLGEKGIGSQNDDTKAGAVLKYRALAEEKAKTLGIKFTEACGLVNAENPDLAKLANSFV